RHNRFSFAPVVRAKPQDVVARDGERRCCATLADDQNIMRVRERLDHSYFGTGLRPDDDLDAARIEVPNSLKRLFRIMLRIANKELKSDRAKLGTDICEICCCNPQCGDGVPAKREPRSG